MSRMGAASPVDHRIVNFYEREEKSRIEGGR